MDPHSMAESPSEKHYSTDAEKRLSNEDVFDRPIDAVEEARILCRVDWNLLPIITLLYLMSFLDR
jgi:hypothetical protein